MAHGLGQIPLISSLLGLSTQKLDTLDNPQQHHQSVSRQALREAPTLNVSNGGWSISILPVGTKVDLFHAIAYKDGSDLEDSRNIDVEDSGSIHSDALNEPELGDWINCTESIDPRWRKLTPSFWWPRDEIRHIQLNRPIRTSLRHTPLPDSKSIRVLRLFKDVHYAPIRCSIRERRDYYKWPYTALSYEWCTPSPDDPVIFIEEKWIPVRRNLYEALLQIRHSMRKDGSFYQDIWIDALCVDQSNVQERNHQVQMMGRIYAGAEEVIVWLGPMRESSDLAMNAFARVWNARALQIKYGDTSIPILRVEGESYSDSVERRFRRQKRLRSIYLSNKEMDAIAFILGRSYWRRMWIIQEIQQAAKLSIRCGAQTLPVEVFEAVGTIFKSSLSRRAEDIWSSFAFLLLFQRLKHRAGIQETLNWWLMFCTQWNCNCSEPRDLVYALMGVASDCQHEEIVVDYSKTTIEVYQDLLVHYQGHYKKFRGEGSLRHMNLLAKRLGVDKLHTTVES